MKRMLVPGLCALALGLAFMNPSEAATKHRAMPPKDRISADSAKTVALAKVPDGHVKTHKLERVGGKWVYSCNVTVPGKSGTEVVNVDAMTGEVVSQHHAAAHKTTPMTNKAISDTTHTSRSS